MGKTLGAVTGGFLQDAGIKSGVEKGRAGYSNAINTLQAGKTQALGFLEPYRDLGTEAISPLSAMLLGRRYNQDTGEYEDVAPEDRMKDFYASPDYNFRLEQGQKSLESSQAAQGGLLSGRAMLEAQRMGQGEAASEYGNYLARLSSLAGMGQQAAGQSANISTGTAGQIAGANIGEGSIAMQGRVARGQIWGDVAGTAGSEAAAASNKISNLMMGAVKGFSGGFSDINLKENIKKVGVSPSGIPIYQFEYKDKSLGKGKYEGVIAQDIEKDYPEAVYKDNGYLKVDYSKIDVTFKEL